MPRISGSTVFPASQDETFTQRTVIHDGDGLRWCVFGAMGVFAMMIIVMGTVTQGRGPWDWKFISYAIHWLPFDSDRSDVVPVHMLRGLLSLFGLCSSTWSKGRNL